MNANETPLPWSQRLLHRFDPEAAHRIALLALRLGLVPRPEPFDDPVLHARVWDLEFRSPVGLAAGFDKDAEVVDAMLGLGFGFVEAGSVTPRPQPGNPAPRLFRLAEDRGVINRFGFNSRGLAPYAARLRARRVRGPAGGIVGANVGRNRDSADGVADYVAGVRVLAGLADYLVCNISSPNTPGLRAMQQREVIAELLARVIAARDEATPPGARRPPLLAKVGPDLSASMVEDIAEVALATGVDGLIVGNTTIDRPATLRSRHAAEAGGLSGAPLLGKADACLEAFARVLRGRLPIVGCGGVSTGEQAYGKIRAGASLVQLYSALVYGGPGLVATINRDLAARLRRDGFSSVSEAVGSGLR